MDARWAFTWGQGRDRFAHGHKAGGSPAGVYCIRSRGDLPPTDSGPSRDRFSFHGRWVRRVARGVNTAHTLFVLIERPIGGWFGGARYRAYATDRWATGSTPITNRWPSSRSAAVRVASFVGCFGSRMRRTSFSSFPIRRANSFLLMPAARTASITASLAAIAGSTATGTNPAPRCAFARGNGKPRAG